MVPPRYGTARRPRRATLGPLLADVAGQLGYQPHVWQRHVADVSLELVRRNGPGSRMRLAAGSVGCVVGRQSGKTLLAASRTTLQCILPDLPAAAALVGIDRIRPQFVGYLAQDRAGAMTRWHEQIDVLMASPLAELVDRVVLTRGDESVHFTNGSVYRVVTPSRTGARGHSLDLAIIDEALAHDTELLSAVSPTMAQRDNARGCIGSQLWVVSNAGDYRSTLLASQRELGRRAVLERDASRAWFEWSCPDDADVSDEAVWRATVPTLDQPDGIGLEYLRREAETLGAERFALEYLCRSAGHGLAGLIDADVWDALPGDELAPDDDVVLAVDATRDRSSATVVVAGRLDPGDELASIAVEVLDQRPGAEWVADYVGRIAVDHQAAVVIDAYGPLSSLIPVLKRGHGVRVRPVRVGDMVDAAAGFCDLVSVGRIAHQHDERLTTAVEVAVKRRVGDRWVFDRRTDVDVSPLIAASLAVWAVGVRAVPRPSIH